MRWIVAGLIAAIAAALPSSAWGQATARPCGAVESAGPACLLARRELSSLPRGKVFWHLDEYPSIEAANEAATSRSVVVTSFGKVWLFTLAERAWRAAGGKHVSTIGPLPIAPAPAYAAEYLRSVFMPGMAAPLHVHSGPEAFYAVSGDTCLETPDGVQVGRGPGNTLLIRAGPPMLLMAIGDRPRLGFALILHDTQQPPTTLIQTWRPEGLCARRLVTERTGAAAPVSAAKPRP